MPLISVVMPAYNCAPYLREAVDSILDQTFTDFEFIIIDDASTDETSSILDSYTDPRIVRIRNARNLGVAETLNVGLDVAQGEYIARMDADDSSLPDRFERQLEFLKHNPAIGVLGSSFLSIDGAGQFLFNKRAGYPEGASPLVCQWESFWASPLAHPTVIMRRAILETHGLRYTKDMNTAEDHDLWCRMQQITRLARTPDIVLHHRLTQSSVSSAQREKQFSTQLKIIQRELTLFWGKPVPEAAALTLLRVVSHEPFEQGHIPAATNLLIETWKRYKRTHPLTVEEQQQIRHWVTQQLLRLARAAKGKNSLPPLLALRKTAPREVFSRNGLKLFLNVFNRSESQRRGGF